MEAASTPHVTRIGTLIQKPGEEAISRVIEF